MGFPSKYCGMMLAMDIIVFNSFWLSVLLHCTSWFGPPLDNFWTLGHEGKERKEK